MFDKVAQEPGTLSSRPTILKFARKTCLDFYKALSSPIIHLFPWISGNFDVESMEGEKT